MLRSRDLEEVFRSNVDHPWMLTYWNALEYRLADYELVAAFFEFQTLLSHKDAGRF